MYIVYQHIFPNGKRYIGITSATTTRRWRLSGKGHESQFVYRAIQKYGWENVRHEIFCVCENKEQAERVEAFLIQRFETTNPKCGYNVLPHGDLRDYKERKHLPYKHTNGNVGKRLTEEEKRVVGERSKLWWKDNDSARINASKRSKNRWENAEYREKMLQILAANRQHPCAEEVKEKIRNAQIGKRAGDESPFSRAVVALTKDGEFVRRYGGVAEAARDVKTSPGNISSCCNHKEHFHSCKGYVWLFEEEYLSEY